MATSFSNFFKHQLPIFDLLVLKLAQPVTRPTPPIVGPYSDKLDDHYFRGKAKDACDLGGDETTEALERWNDVCRGGRVAARVVFKKREEWRRSS